MKVAIECNSPLLQRSLELFLATKVSTYKQCDIVVSDKKMEFEKPYIYIGSEAEADLVKPFSKSQLLLAIENLVKSKQEIKEINDIVEEVNSEASVGVMNFDVLEKRIELLTLEYQKNILNTVKAFYEK